MSRETIESKESREKREGGRTLEREERAKTLERRGRGRRYWIVNDRTDKDREGRETYREKGENNVNRF